MLLDGIRFERVWAARHGSDLRSRSLIALMNFFEEQLGARFLYDRRDVPLLSPHLADLFDIAAQLKERGVIKSISKNRGLHDEPRIHLWSVQCATTTPHTAGGISYKNERGALVAALAESLERYLWYQEDDYFIRTRLATEKDMANSLTLSPNQFSGFSEQQRLEEPRMRFRENAQYTWIEGYSWTKRSRIYFPAQVVSAFHARRKTPGGEYEPSIRPIITTGLATWPTREGALLRGALEVLERDAFMIMWLNQISCPRRNWDDLTTADSELESLLEDCKRYRLQPHVIHLCTDAPTEVACVVIEDLSGSNPVFAVGIKAHISLARAAEGALLEALRARLGVRTKESTTSPPDTSGSDRLRYWMDPEHAKHLSFLIKGPVQPMPKSNRGDAKETEREQFRRIIEWCKRKNYELVSVDLGRSKKNPLPWHIQMIVIPELQPMHQNEHYPALGGKRLTEIPKEFGYTPLPQPYAERPHPFK